MKRGKHCKSSSNLKTKPILAIIIILTIVISTLFCIFNVNNIIAFFTDYDTIVNEITIISTYTVTFNSNNDTGETTTQEIPYGEATNLTENSFTKKGYAFVGWSTNIEGGGTEYKDLDSVTDLGDITLYAQWEIETYNIKYILNDGTVEKENLTEYTVETKDFTLTNPTKTGYTFKGWSGTDLDGDTNLDVTILEGSTGERTYTANWIANTYYIKFNANGGGRGPMPEQAITYDTPTKLDANKFVKNGYVFVKWTTQEDGGGDSYKDCDTVYNLTTINNEEINLYAQWGLKPTKYAVQVYGIKQDVDAEGNPLGLTFGPAVGQDYSNKYVTHKYEDDDNDGIYNVIIETHTVNSEGEVTKIDTENLQNSSGENVTRTEEEVNKYKDVILHNMTWEQIAEKSKSNPEAFKDAMLCGDTKSVELTFNDKIKTTSSIIYQQYGDGVGALKNTINEYYCRWNPTSKQNEAATAGGSNASNAREAGGYSSSHMRATLVGADEKTLESYAGDDNLTKEDCLYSCIEEDVRKVIKAKKVKYITGSSVTNNEINDDISDTIWLFSERELYGTGQKSGETKEGLGEAGDGYNKFGDEESKYYIGTYDSGKCDSRKCYNESGLTYWWLRSPFLNSTSSVDSIYYLNGSCSGNLAYAANGISFGFCLE